MYFFLSNTFGFFSQPTNVILFLAGVGFVLMPFRYRLGRSLLICTSISLVIAGLSPLGNMLLTPLEQRFPGLKYPEHIDGVIVLGGSYDRIRGYLSTVLLDDNTPAFTVVASLARRYPDAKIVFSGGTAVADVHVPPEAEAAKLLFLSFGIEPNRLVIEDQSRNTKENARLTFDAIKPKPGSHWLLVTNAFHMPRSVGTFREAGFDVAAFPVGWRTNGWRDFFWPAPFVTENLRRVDVATREWFGLVIYWAVGYSTTLFPGPLESTNSS